MASAAEDRAMLGSNPSAVADHRTDAGGRLTPAPCHPRHSTGSRSTGSAVSSVWCPNALNPGSGQSPVNAQRSISPAEVSMPARRGRPHEGPELVDKLDDCSEQARQRLKVIVQTLAGLYTVEQACEVL